MSSPYLLVEGQLNKFVDVEDVTEQVVGVLDGNDKPDSDIPNSNNNRSQEVSLHTPIQDIQIDDKNPLVPIGARFTYAAQAFIITNSIDRDSIYSYICRHCVGGTFKLKALKQYVENNIQYLWQDVPCVKDLVTRYQIDPVVFAMWIIAEQLARPQLIILTQNLERSNISGNQLFVYMLCKKDSNLKTLYTLEDVPNDEIRFAYKKGELVVWSDNFIINLPNGCTGFTYRFQFANKQYWWDTTAHHWTTTCVQEVDFLLPFCRFLYQTFPWSHAMSAYDLYKYQYSLVDDIYHPTLPPPSGHPDREKDQAFFYHPYRFRVLGQKLYEHRNSLYKFERIRNASMNWYEDMSPEKRTDIHAFFATLSGCLAVYKFYTAAYLFSIPFGIVSALLYCSHMISVYINDRRNRFKVYLGSSVAVILIFSIILAIKRRLKRSKAEQALTIRQAEGVAMILQFVFREGKEVMKDTGHSIPKNYEQLVDHIDKRISNWLKLFQGLEYTGAIRRDQEIISFHHDTQQIVIEQGWRENIGDRLMDIKEFCVKNAIWVTFGSLSAAVLCALVYYAINKRQDKIEEGLSGIDDEKILEMPGRKGGVSRHQPDMKLKIASRTSRTGPVQSRNVNLFDQLEPATQMYAGRFYAQGVDRLILDRVAAKELGVDELWQYDRIYIVTENNTLIPIAMRAAWSNKAYLYDVFKTIAEHAKMHGNRLTFKVFPGSSTGKISDPVLVNVNKSDMLQPIPKHEQGKFGDAHIVNGLHKVHEVAKKDIIHQAVTNLGISETDKSRLEHADNAYSELFSIIGNYDLAARIEEQYPQALLRGRRFDAPDLLKSQIYYRYDSPGGPKEGNAFIMDRWWWTANHVAKDLYKDMIIMTNHGHKVVQSIMKSAKDDVCKFQLRDFDPTKSSAPMFEPPSLKYHYGDYNGLGFILSWKRETSNYIPQLSMGYCVRRDNHCFHYIPTQGGDSGSAVLSEMGEVLFIHQGALSNHNYGHTCVMICPEIEVKGIQQRYMQDISENEPPVQDIIVNYPGMRHLKNGNLKIVGSISTVGGSLRQRDPKFVKSAFYDLHAAECGLPAEPFQRFGPTVPSSEVLWKDIAKYDCDPSKDWHPDIEILNMTIEVQRLKFNRVYPRQAYIRSFIFALRFIDFTKASGWPYLNLFATKYQAIQWMCRRFPKFWNEILMCDNPEDYLLWVQHHKEELRAVEKLLEEKHRSVNGGPFEHLVASKMIFGDLHDMWYACEFSLKNSTVGWSPFKGGVHALVSYMKKHPVHYCTDLKKQDSRTANELRDIAFELDIERIDFDDVRFENEIPAHISLWSKDIQEVQVALDMKQPYDNVKRAKSLITQGKKPLMKVEDNIVKREHGLSSGEDRTLQENTKNNDFSWTYCVIKYYRDVILKRHSLKGFTPIQILQHIDECYRHMHCGDDSWWSTEENGMNGQYYHDVIKELAFDSEFGPGSDIGEVAYCGMRYIEINDIWFFTPDEPWKVIASAALEKRAFKDDRMQHFSKLDALALLSAMDVEMSMKIIKLRNILIRELFFDSTYNRIRPRSHLECVKLHFPEYENIHPQILEDNYQVITGWIKDSCAIFYEQGLTVFTSTVRFHGQYCGPNWSAGQVQTSVPYSDVIPIDDFDYTCQQHDFSYGRNEDLDEADQLFFERNFGKGFKRSVAASLVKIQQMTRNKKNKIGKKKPGNKKKGGMNKQKKNSQKVEVLPQRPNRGMGRRQLAFVQKQPNPISVGYSARRSTRFRTVRRTGKIEIVVGTDYYGVVSYNNGAGNVAGDNLVQFAVHPSIFVGSRLAVYNNLFQYYKFKKFGVEFVPNKGTNTDGQLAMFYVPDPDDATLVGTDNVRVADASRKALFFSIYEHKIAWLPINGTVKKYYTNQANTDNRFVQQALFYLIAHSNLNAGLGTLGTIRIHFVIQFEEPYVGTFSQTAYSSWKSGGSPTLINPFGTPVQDSNSTMAVNFTAPGGVGTFTITNQQIGQYLFFGYAISGNLSSATVLAQNLATFFAQHTDTGPTSTGYYIWQVTGVAPTIQITFASNSVVFSRAFFTQMASAAPTAPPPKPIDLQTQIDDLRDLIRKMKGKERVEEVDESDENKSVGSTGSKEKTLSPAQQKELLALRQRLGIKPE